MSNFSKKLFMYHKVHQQKREGLKIAQISRELGLDPRTVKNYLAMTAEQYHKYLDRQRTRKKELDVYEPFVKMRLETCEDASAAQVHDWLKEHFTDLPDVTERTVLNFVMQIRSKHGIPKPFGHRDYSKLDEPPYGKQAQVDFGEYNMTAQEGTRKKIYFFCMVLSRSRQKFTWYSEHPFTTLAAIAAHERALQFFEGITEQVVYDQDTLFLVNENIGDLILTEAFRKYAEYRRIKLHFCRKSDPESKGKVENVVKYIKHNFLRGRTFINIHVLNEQGLAWLQRTANAKVHAATRKVPQDEWIIEKQYLRPILDHFKPQVAFNSYNVRKDNTIIYKGNFYRVPIGTYQGPKTIVWTEHTDDLKLIIYDSAQQQIASHKIYMGKGKTIGGSNYKRDFSSGIDQMIEELSCMFTDREGIKNYLLHLRNDKPRYIRDQLQHIKKLAGNYDIKIMDMTLSFCIENKIYRATDFGSVARKFFVMESQQSFIAQPIAIRTINQSAHKITPNKSNISDYQRLMQ
ncbi:MAG TPA: IS21 family transposase [Bacteroidaceae bacterium]|nr:IS21 family transposase [Bacteroidaceae bacterium]